MLVAVVVDTVLRPMQDRVSLDDVLAHDWMRTVVR